MSQSPSEENLLADLEARQNAVLEQLEALAERLERALVEHALPPVHRAERSSGSQSPGRVAA